MDVEEVILIYKEHHQKKIRKPLCGTPFQVSAVRSLPSSFLGRRVGFVAQRRNTRHTTSVLGVIRKRMNQ